MSTRLHMDLVTTNLLQISMPLICWYCISPYMSFPQAQEERHASTCRGHGEPEWQGEREARSKGVSGRDDIRTGGEQRGKEFSPVIVCQLTWHVVLLPHVL